MKNDSVCLEHWLASVEKNSVGEELHAPTGQLLASNWVMEIHGKFGKFYGETVSPWSVWIMEIDWTNLQAWRVWWFWSQVDRKEGNAIVWFTQHLDMPEWEDQDIVNKEEADTWIGNNWEKSLQCRCIWMLLKFQLCSPTMYGTFEIPKDLVSFEIVLVVPYILN